MSLLKRIGGSGPLDERQLNTGYMNSGQLGNNVPGPSGGSNGTNVLPRPTTNRLNNADEGIRRPGTLSNQENMLELKNRVQQRLIAELDPKLDLTKTDEVRRTVEDIFGQILEQENIVLSRVERARLFEAVAAEILGFGS